jgi:hypothetical protein
MYPTLCLKLYPRSTKVVADKSARPKTEHAYSLAKLRPEYAPYDTMPEFDEGMAAYEKGDSHKTPVRSRLTQKPSAAHDTLHVAWSCRQCFGDLKTNGNSCDMMRHGNP